jgi:3-methyladenine DNA glycosylase
MEKQRCSWVPLDDELYLDYHDKEWGIPVHDDHTLFEMLVLEGMQAGLNWITILRKREGYRKAFDNFAIDEILKYDDQKIEELMQNPNIIRNRLKINSVINNAKAFREVQAEFGSFAEFIWRYVDGKPLRIIRNGETHVPARTELSDQISKDLKKRGFKFIGSTTICAYMHAVGLIDGHTDNCFCKR